MPLASGAAVVTINSADIHKDILAEAVAKLTAKVVSHALTFDPSLGACRPRAGAARRLHLEAIYPGDAKYAPATATVPLSIPMTCGLADLYI